MMISVLGSASCVVEDDPVTATESAAVIAGNGVIPRAASWAFWDKGGDLGTAWRAVDYDDTTWGTGAGPLLSLIHI